MRSMCVKDRKQRAKEPRPRLERFCLKGAEKGREGQKTRLRYNHLTQIVRFHFGFFGFFASSLLAVVTVTVTVTVAVAVAVLRGTGCTAM